MRLAAYVASLAERRRQRGELPENDSETQEWLYEGLLPDRDGFLRSLERRSEPLNKR